MIVTRAEIIGDKSAQFFQTLELLIDGKLAQVIQPKIAFLQAGYCPIVGIDVPDLQLPPNWHPDYPDAATVYGVTDNPVVVYLARQWIWENPGPGVLRVPSLAEAKAAPAPVGDRL